MRQVPISVDEIQNNFSQFVANMQEIISKSAAQYKDFKIDSVEVSAEISADGQIGLMGTHVGLSGTAGITIVFKAIT